MVGGGFFNMWWFILYVLYVYLIDIFIKMNFCFKINYFVGSFRIIVLKCGFIKFNVLLSIEF